MKNVTILSDGTDTYPKIDLNKLRVKVLSRLARSNKALTGSQLRYIRQFMGYTVRDLANVLCVSHATVVKWEKKNHDKTMMTYGTEILIKTSLLIELDTSPEKFLKDYSKIVSFGIFEEPSKQLEL